MNSRKPKPCARGLFKFEGQTDQELSFSPGESILLLRRVDENWLEGELNGKVGIFPSNRVRIELGSPSLSRESVLARSGKPCGMVLYNFPGTAEGDLALEKGQLVQLLSNVGGGWVKGRVDDRVGIFPSSFVEVLTPLTSNKPTPRPKPMAKPKPKPRRQLSTPEPMASSFPKPKPRTIAQRPPAPRVRRQTAPVLYTQGQQQGNTAAVAGAGAGGRGSGSAGAGSGDRKPASATPPVPRPRTRQISVSTLEFQLSSLESSLEVEEKMLKSAKSLLKVVPTEEKKVQLSAKAAKHAESVESLKQQISEIEEQRNELLGSRKKTAPPVPPAPTSMAASPKQPSKPSSRQRAMNELIATESDYHNEIAAFCLKVLPEFKQWTEVKWELVFSNLEQLVKVSGQLYAALTETSVKEERNEKVSDGERTGIGEVFQTFAPRLRETYAIYCRNHDQACTIMEKWAEDAAKTEKLKELMDKGRPEVTSWNLQTLLIKPVQRVLKYPLLLDKLLQLTPVEHVDHKPLSAALNTISKVAQDINELKRRKDLVERYTGAGRDEKHINMNTLRKKMRRFQQTLTQMTGLRSATVDPVFADLEQRVIELETCLRTLRDNLDSWHEKMELTYTHKQSLVEAMQLYSKDSLAVKRAEQALIATKETWRDHYHQLHDRVLDPLNTLIGLFNDPSLLISKRRDKLLDYDSLQHDLEKASETDRIQQLRERCELAKRNYEALNFQLLEELPLFCERVGHVAAHLLQEFTYIQHSYHQSVVSALMSCGAAAIELEVEEPDSAEGVKAAKPLEAQQIITTLSSALAAVSQNLSQLSIVPVSLSTSFSVRQLNKTTTPPSKLQLTLPAANTHSLVQSLDDLEDPAPYSTVLFDEINDVDESHKESVSLLNHGQDSLDATPISSPPPPPPYAPADDKDVNIIQESSSPPHPPPPYAPADDKDLNSIQEPSPLPSPPPPYAPDDKEPDSPEDDLPTVGSILTVAYDFLAENRGELSVASGQLVTLLALHDHSGDTDWYLVRTESEEGYVPANFLATTQS